MCILIFRLCIETIQGYSSGMAIKNMVTTVPKDVSNIIFGFNLSSCLIILSNHEGIILSNHSHGQVASDKW